MRIKALLLAPFLVGALLALGCENYEYEDGVPRDEADVNVDLDNGAPAEHESFHIDTDPEVPTIDPRDDGSEVDVDVDSEEGIQVDVDGQPIRERIEERREERQNPDES